MNNVPPIGILGGTFDPIHLGHLRPALELVEQLRLQQIRFIPSNVPPHRPQPQASGAQRLAMLQLATADEPLFVIDQRELERAGPSYTVDTLLSLRAELPSTPLCLCVGLDAFLGLPQWYDWQRIRELAHIVVSHRPGWRMDEESLQPALHEWLNTHRASDPDELHQQLAGRIWLQQVSQLAISATEIRTRIASGRSARYLLPEPVWGYIQQQQLYLK